MYFIRSIYGAESVRMDSKVGFLLHSKYTHGETVNENRIMRTANNVHQGTRVPLWIRRPGALHAIAYVVAALVFIGQVVLAIITGSDLVTVLVVAAAAGSG